jgi:hypothetical protein
MLNVMACVGPLTANVSVSGWPATPTASPLTEVIKGVMEVVGVLMVNGVVALALV